MSRSSRPARTGGADSTYHGTGADRDARRQDALDAWAGVLDRIEESVKQAADAAAGGEVEDLVAAAAQLAATPKVANGYGPLPAELALRARNIVAAHQDAAASVSAQMDKVRRELTQAAGRARRGNTAPTGNGSSLDIDV